MPATLPGRTRPATDHEVPTARTTDIDEPGPVEPVLESLVLLGCERQRRFVVELIGRDVTDKTGFRVFCSSTGSIVGNTSFTVTTIVVVIISVTAYHFIS
ncbi:hypothetical protein [Halorubrum sp. 48-1-W]|uniref:hypothetical protein n=1 Tax=Halorubrum sp. 48-1-W TaxID=2249761 RepID=UPI001F53F411|nr:hypothetical protein [Halorubrum sp. 48-1-W]